MTSRFKLKFLKLISWGIRRVMLFLGVETSDSVFFTGLPRIKMVKGGRIVLKENVTIHSWWYVNPGLNHRSTLAVISPEAELILSDNVGISGSTIICSTKIIIGENTLIGADAFILDNDMHLPGIDGIWLSTYGSTQAGAPISIGRSCFIGARAIILKGVTIGEGSVVAAGAVVTRNVPPYSLAIGNPAQNKPLPERFKSPDSLKKM